MSTYAVSGFLWLMIALTWMLPVELRAIIGGLGVLVGAQFALWNVQWRIVLRREKGIK
jgi:hypothetical protein